MLGAVLCVSMADPLPQLPSLPDMSQVLEAAPDLSRMLGAAPSLLQTVVSGGSTIIREVPTVISDTSSAIAVSNIPGIAFKAEIYKKVIGLLCQVQQPPQGLW